MEKQIPNDTNARQIKAVLTIQNWYRSVIMLKKIIETLNVDYDIFEENHHETGVDNVEIDIIKQLNFIGQHINLKNTFTVPYPGGTPHLTSLLHLACDIRLPQLVLYLLNEHSFEAHMALPVSGTIPLFYNLNYSGFKTNYNKLYDHRNLKKN